MSVADASAPCAASRDRAQEWCVLEAAVSEPSAWSELPGLCGLLSEDATRDRCLEVVARQGVPVPGLDWCRGIADSRLASACRIELAARTADDSWAESLEVCAGAGLHARTCAARMIETRGVAWASDFTAAAATAQVAQMIDRIVGLERDADFGGMLGTAARSLKLRPGEAGPCDALIHGAGRLACDAAQRDVLPKW